MNNETPKQKLAQGIIALIGTFEKETGVEVFNFKIQRVDCSTHKDYLGTSVICKIEFDLK